jgi:hypothetical protein
MNDLILCTNWEKVEKDDFYLSKDWEKEEGGVKEARELQKDGNLFVAYLVPAKSLAIYKTMDASQVFINKEGDAILNCESAVIDSEFTERWEYNE